jgi:hypothetical protein
LHTERAYNQNRVSDESNQNNYLRNDIFAEPVIFGTVLFLGVAGLFVFSGKSLQ